jgi:hypothetical protein
MTTPPMTPTTTRTTTFRLLPTPADVLQRARAGRPDAWGSPPVPVTAGGGEPLRCCRTDAVSGEELLLVAFRPALPRDDSPYQEVGAVFLHAEACAGPASSDTYPADWRSRPQVLRAYDERGWIHPATRVHDGTDPERELAEVLATPGVVAVHSRNVAYGCWMFTAVPA